jgi:hypothetical protein
MEKERQGPEDREKDGRLGQCQDGTRLTFRGVHCVHRTDSAFKGRTDFRVEKT